MASTESANPRNGILVITVFLAICLHILINYDFRPEVPEDVAAMMAKGTYGIDFVDNDAPVLNEKPVDYKKECKGTLKLKSLDNVESLPYGIVFVETSARGNLFPRQACAVESAVRRSGLPVSLFMVAEELDLSDNTTCQIVRGETFSKVNIYHLDLETFARDTPLDGFLTSDKLLKGKNMLSHMSDCLRMLIVYKYGGLYMDLDYVIINDMTHYNNFVIEEVEPNFVKMLETMFIRNFGITTHKWFESILTGSAFSFPPRHPYVKMVLENIVASYDNPTDWAIIGPTLVTTVFKNFTGTENVLEVDPRETGIHVVREPHIMGVMPYKTPYLFSKSRSIEEWKTVLQNSSSLHFSSSFTSKHYPNIDRTDPGSSAYSLLAPHICPVSLWSNKDYF